MAERDPLRVVEAGYRWHADEQGWLAQIAEAAAPFGPGGVAAYVVSLDTTPRVRSIVSHQTHATFADSLRTFSTAFAPPVARAMFAPTEFVGNALYRLARIANQQSRSPRELLGGAKAIAGWALIGGDVRREVVVLTFPAKSQQLAADQAFPHSRTLGLAAAHLASALRLRALVAPFHRDDTATEAVLSPRGKVLHATAATVDARETLVEAVLRSERARGRLRRQAPDEALATWTALVDGQWSIVDFVDRDGKRMLLARRNPPNGGDVLGLSDEERSVAWHAALGHSNKYIAYELGMSLGKVMRRLASALRKLHLGSRRELLRRLGGSAVRSK